MHPLIVLDIDHDSIFPSPFMERGLARHAVESSDDAMNNRGRNNKKCPQ